MNQFYPYVETSAVLAASAEFVSDVIAADFFKNIIGSVYADTSGDIYVEQSWDGVNWDVQKNITVAAADGVAINEVVVAPQFRIRYVNGTTAQTEFRLFAGGKF